MGVGPSLDIAGNQFAGHGKKARRSPSPISANPLDCQHTGCSGRSLPQLKLTTTPVAKETKLLQPSPLFDRSCCFILAAGTDPAGVQR